MPATRILLLRHGETAWNIEDRYQGQADSPLTPAGQAQAAALAVRLARGRLDVLYSSDLGRARATAWHLTQATGAIPVLDARLRERALGVFQGLTRREAEERFPEPYRRLRSGDPDYAVPEGESPRQHLERTVACLNDLAGRHPGETVAVVTHGGAVTLFLRHVLELPLVGPRRFSRANASWNSFLHQAGRWQLETWGDVSHLESPPAASQPAPGPG